jgi:hypothetical protein
MSLDSDIIAIFESTSDNELYVNFDPHAVNKCPICKKKFTLKQLVFDHCHRTGLQRGRLCVKCNAMIGMACDNPVTLSNAIDYLAEWFVTHAKVGEERKARHDNSQAREAGVPQVFESPFPRWDPLHPLRGFPKTPLENKKNKKR